MLCNTDGREGGETSSNGLREGAMKRGADDGTGMRQRSETQIKWQRTKERKSWQMD